MNALIAPKEIKIADPDGLEKEFTISKFPALQGREIVTQYPIANMPKIGSYAVSEELMLKLMKFVAVRISGELVPLSTRALVDNHIGDWETLGKVEMAMMEYNCSFFRNGTLSTFLGDVVQKFLAKISETLTQSSAQSSQTGKQPSMSSEPSTP